MIRNANETAPHITQRSLGKNAALQTPTPRPTLGAGSSLQASSPAQGTLFNTPWPIALLLALAGSALTVAVQRIVAWWEARAKELGSIYHASAAVKMLISSIENRVVHFPTVGYDKQALTRTLSLLLTTDIVRVIERFDDKYYWRLGDIEQHADLINLYVELRNDSIRDARPIVQFVDEETLKTELRRLHEECRAEVYRTLRLLENAEKDRRYAFVRPFVGRVRK